MLGPDDLHLADKIIIGFTCGVVVVVLIVAVVMGSMHCYRQQKQAKGAPNTDSW